jgi:hypothetical protein
MNSTSSEDIDALIEKWDAALHARDLETLLACYAPDAILNTPAATHIAGSRGALQGTAALRSFLGQVIQDAPIDREYYRASTLTDGRRVILEVPPRTPSGSTQISFLETLEIENGLIVTHTVYWGGSIIEASAQTEDAANTAEVA